MVDHDRYYDLVIERTRPLNDVEVSKGDWVEGSWADRASLHSETLAIFRGVAHYRESISALAFGQIPRWPGKSWSFRLSLHGDQGSLCE